MRAAAARPGAAVRVLQGPAGEAPQVQAGVEAGAAAGTARSSSSTRLIRGGGGHLVDVEGFMLTWTRSHAGLACRSCMT